jgi:hypothetical protein
MTKGLDTKQKIELAITVGGILLLIFLTPGAINKVRDRNIKKAGSYNESVLDVPEPFVLSERRYRMEGDWGKDIFYPDIPFSGAGSPGVTAGLVLNGIVWDNNAPYAIINSKIVKAGDKVDAATIIIDITEKSVIVEQDGTRHTIELTKF